MVAAVAGSGAAGDYGPLPWVLFVLFALMAVGPAFAVAFSRNIVRGAVSLLFSLIGVSGLYFLLHAEFLAAVQLVVYVGGTLILMIFGIMLTAKSPGAGYGASRGEVLWGTLVALALALPLGWLVLATSWGTRGLVTTGAAATRPTVEDLGMALLDPHGFLLPFEVLSVLLLAVMIGAAYLAKARRPAKSAAAAQV